MSDQEQSYNVFDFPDRSARGKPIARDDTLNGGGGGGTFTTMEERLAKLETHFDYVQRDLGEIKELLKVLPSLATKADIHNWKIQWTAIIVAAFAIIVGSIIGGLGWLETRVDHVQPPAISAASTPQPIIIQLPAQTRTK